MSRRSIMLMMEYENALAELYNLFSLTFEELSSFWQSLSKEEINHANMISGLLVKVDDENLFLNENRFKEEPLEVSLDYVSEIMERTRKGELTIINALAIASSIENSIIEAKYLELFTGESAQMGNILSQLREETIKHRTRITEMLEKVRNNTL